MNYTVKKLSNLAGISVRAIHYYDEIGLLKPSAIKENGYRVYSDQELTKLQQILFFRELEFPLEKIKQIMQATEFDSLQALNDQRSLLELKKKRLEHLLLTIDKTINSLKGGESMSNDDKFSVFNDPTYQKYKDEVEQRWGQTQAYKQSKERANKMTKADWERIKNESEDIYKQFTAQFKSGVSTDSSGVQVQVERFYQHLRNFYDLSYKMFKNLGQMYVDDPSFRDFYEKRANGLAVFMRDALAIYANEHEQKA